MILIFIMANYINFQMLNRLHFFNVGLFIIILFINLFIWLHPVLVAAGVLLS